MKKIMPIIIVIMLALCGCGSESSKYAEKLDSIIENGTVSYYTAEDLIRDYAVKDEENTKYLNYVKKQLSQFKQFDEFSSLNWKAFDDVKSIYWLDAGKAKNLPEGVDISNWDAIYSKELGGIVFFPEISLYSEDQQFHVTTHELCHALLESFNDQKQNAFIIEGEVELMALSFSRMLEIEDAKPTYPNGVFVAAWLNTLFGGQEVREAIIADHLNDMIDGVVGDGACRQINIGGGLADSYESEIGRNAAIEVLCHLSKSMDKANIGEEFLKDSTNFEGVDIKYFKRILSS